MNRLVILLFLLSTLIGCEEKTDEVANTTIIGSAWTGDMSVMTRRNVTDEFKLQSTEAFVIEFIENEDGKYNFEDGGGYSHFTYKLGSNYIDIDPSSTMQLHGTYFIKTLTEQNMVLEQYSDPNSMEILTLSRLH